jgi:hypothetical protein
MVFAVIFWYIYKEFNINSDEAGSHELDGINRPHIAEQLPQETQATIFTSTNKKLQDSDEEENFESIKTSDV